MYHQMAMTQDEERLRARVQELEAEVKRLRIGSRAEALVDRILADLDSAKTQHVKWGIWAEPGEDNIQTGQWTEAVFDTEEAAQARVSMITRAEFKVNPLRKWHYEARPIPIPPSWHEQLMEDD